MEKQVPYSSQNGWFLTTVALIEFFHLWLIDSSYTKHISLMVTTYVSGSTQDNHITEFANFTALVLVNNSMVVE